MGSILIIDGKGEESITNVNSLSQEERKKEEGKCVSLPS
jgi:hypothetical protein